MTEENFKPDFTKDNPYEGAPEDYIEKIKGTRAYESAVGEGWIPDTSTPSQPSSEPWKPDFTKPNPYEGAPSDYFRREAEAFVPSSELIAPPSQRFFESQPQYTPADYVAAPPKTIDIGTATEQPITVYHTREIRELQQKDPYLYDILVNQGPDAYKEAVEQRLGAEKLVEEDWNKSHTKLPDGKYIANDELAKMKEQSPEVYDILITEGFTPAIKYVDQKNREFEETLKESSPELYSVYKEQGLNAYLEVAGKLNTEYEKFQKEIESGNIIELPDGKYIDKATFDKQPEGIKDILREEGFSGHFAGIELRNKVAGQIDTERNRAIAEWLEDNPYPGWTAFMSESEWQDPDKNNRLRAVVNRTVDATNKKLLAQMTDRERELYDESNIEFGKNLGINLLSAIAPPARALKPEYTLKDISGAEWALTGVNTALIATGFAPGAILGSTLGKTAIIGLSSAGAGVTGYETAKNWSELSNAQRAMGVGATVLYALPALVTVARNVKVSSVRIPQWEETGVKGLKISGFTPEGEPMSAPVWKGLSVAEHPVVGRSGGKWVIGAREISLPEARLIMEGYHPERMLETKVFVNPKSLKASGWTQTQIDYLTKTLKSRNLFAGQKSPYLSKEALLEPTQRLTVDEIDVLLRQINDYNTKIKNVDLLYGSSTIKSQLAPELRGWRAVHDWDISTTMSASETESFARSILTELEAIGKGRYRISPTNPTLVEKYIDGQWVHIADIHSKEVVPGLLDSVGSSKLDVTGDYSYGRMVSEPAITVEYPGVGKFDIMSLSESGVRKADTILRVRQTAEGTAFRPPERGISQPGVPKDAADFYVTLRTFKGESIAEEWLESWAKAMGYTPDELAGVLPNIRRAIIEVAENTPSNLIGYRFTPAKSTYVSPDASPKITVHIPSSLGASISGSLATKISSPVLPYKLAADLEASIPYTVRSAYASYKGLPSSSIPVVSQSIGLASPPVVSSPPSPSQVSSIQPSPIPSPSPSVPSGKPSEITSPVPSGAPSVPPSPSQYGPPSDYPSPVPSPSVSPPPTEPPPEEPPPTPPPSPKPPVIPKVSGKTEKIKEKEGAVAWRQGFVWWVIYPPYKSKRDIKCLKQPPKGATVVKGPGSAYKTVQALGGDANIVLEIDLGIFDVQISRPSGAGKTTAIKYKRDVKKQTTKPLSVAGVKAS